MTSKDTIKRELSALTNEGRSVVEWLNNHKSEEKISFGPQYQNWYTKAFKAVQFLAPDRLPEFRSYYETDSKRKEISVDSYTIQDFIKGFEHAHPSRSDHFDAKQLTMVRILNQVHILGSLESRIDGVLADVEGLLIADFIDGEVEAARRLMRVNLRASGALAGFVLEDHLQRVAKTHAVNILKKNPTIADLNDPLRAANVYDVATWRKIQYLTDLRNICCHQKGVDPTTQQVEELVEGANWAVKNIR